MGFDENAGNTDGDGRARQGLDNSTIAAGRGRPPARLLHRMRRIENHRRTHRRHDRQRAHVETERVVPEGGAALAQEHIRITAFIQFLRARSSCPNGARNWPFFPTLTTRPVFAAATRRIGLAREEREDLQTSTVFATPIDCTALPCGCRSGPESRTPSSDQLKDFHGLSQARCPPLPESERAPFALSKDDL